MLHIEKWPDEVLERHGHPIHSHYVEVFHLPQLGPSTVLMARRLVVLIGNDVEVDELSQMLGLGAGVGRNSPVMRTLGRLERFGCATIVKRPDDDLTVAIRTHLAPLTRRQAMRLPPALRAYLGHLESKERAA